MEVKPENKLFIATSIDGYISDKNGGIDWLHSVPNPEGNDMGYSDFMKTIDAIIMGRNTFEVVCGFDIPWPYEQPVFVMSTSLKEIPEELKDRVHLVKGSLPKVLQLVHQQGFKSLYIDGGGLIQEFLKEDLIDEMTITTIPILLGGGTHLFGELIEPLDWTLKASKVYLNTVVQSVYTRS